MGGAAFGRGENVSDVSVGVGPAEGGRVRGIQKGRENALLLCVGSGGHGAGRRGEGAGKGSCGDVRGGGGADVVGKRPGLGIGVLFAWRTLVAGGGVATVVLIVVTAVVVTVNSCTPLSASPILCISRDRGVMFAATVFCIAGPLSFFVLEFGWRGA